MSNALDKVLSNINKTYGKNSIMKLGERADNKIEMLSSGSLLLNEALGGGYPYGRIIEIYGGESSGKSTCALLAIKEAQKLGKNVAFIDAEHALDPEYAKLLGVDTNNLIITQPDFGEQGLEILDKLVESNEVGVVVVDSVSALVPKAELEGDMGQSNIGVHARLMSQAMRKITGKIHKTNCVVIFINQIRMKIGTYGNPETTTGGNALKFYASQRLHLTKSQQIKDSNGDTIGHELKVKIVKNKVAPPYRMANLKLFYGKGFSIEEELIDVCVNLGIIKKSGSWYSYGDIKLGQGTNNVRELLEDNIELFEELKEKIKTANKELKNIKENE